jgi:hypothetical protein
MKKLFLLLLLCVPAMAFGQQMLQGGVVQQVKVDQARNAAFQAVPNRINTSAFYSTDPDFMLHAQAKARGQSCLPDSRLTFFNDGGYTSISFGGSVMYYYTAQGNLFALEILSSPATPESYSTFPMRGAKYLYPSGVLLSTRFTPIFAEDYSFNLNGSLQSYCLQNVCYKPNGTILTIRKKAINCLQVEAQIRPH